MLAIFEPVPAELNIVTARICTAVACSPLMVRCRRQVRRSSLSVPGPEDDTRLELRDSPYTHPLRNVGASYTRAEQKGLACRNESLRRLLLRTATSRKLAAGSAS